MHAYSHIRTPTHRFHHFWHQIKKNSDCLLGDWKKWFKYYLGQFIFRRIKKTFITEPGVLVKRHADCYFVAHILSRCHDVEQKTDMF